MEQSKCKNCEASLYGKFCSNCGQKVYSDKDKKIGSLTHEVLHFLTHLEGKVFKTFKTIFRSPGKLSVDYCNGIRQRYYKPVSFYILIIFLYLLFPIASGMNMEMKYHRSAPIIGNFISKQIDAKLIKENITEEQLSELYHNKSKNTSKFLLLLLIPLTAPVIYLLYINKKRYLFDNFILATEINIFFLITFFILIPLLLLPFFSFFDMTKMDKFYGPFILILFSAYCSLVFRKVFSEKWWLTILKGILFSLIFLFVINAVYKAIVFEVTFALI